MCDRSHAALRRARRCDYFRVILGLASRHHPPPSRPRWKRPRRATTTTVIPRRWRSASPARETDCFKRERGFCRSATEIRARRSRVNTRRAFENPRFVGEDVSEHEGDLERALRSLGRVAHQAIGRGLRKVFFSGIYIFLRERARRPRRRGRSELHTSSSPKIRPQSPHPTPLHFGEERSPQKKVCAVGCGGRRGRRRGAEEDSTRCSRRIRLG